jgi:uncharacterized membrane protein
VNASGAAPTPAATPIEPAHRIELAVARILGVITVVAMALLLAGVALMVATGVDVESVTFPPFDPARIVSDLVALRPEGFLWAGIVVVVASPIVRVSAELVGFARVRDRTMAMVAAGILLVVAVSVLTALALET